MERKIRPWKAWKRFPIRMSGRCYRTDKWGNELDAPWSEPEIGVHTWTEVEFRVKGSDTKVIYHFEGIIKSEEEIDKVLEKLGKPQFDYLTEELLDSFFDSFQKTTITTI